jgi:hypothetical protein
MVSLYNLFDVVFIVVFFYFTYKSYKEKIYLKIFEYVKFFIIIIVSAKLVHLTALLLNKLHIIKADTYTTLIFIAFIVNFLLLFYFYKNIMKLFKRYINSVKIKDLFAKFLTLLEVLITLTFTIYMVMQLYISKKYLYKTSSKTYIYPIIENFYNKFLGDDFVNLLLNSDTKTNYKEVMFKSFKNSI